jgi:hypothetical protein
MSNPTTPFSWQMPTAVELVTDLPADFEVFGQAVATSMADLLGGTTGQILSKTTNADMDFTWVSANPGDITGVTAGTGISGGGTSGDVTVTNSMATAIDAKGDLIGGTGSDTFARLAVGTNGQVLTADSVETTGLKWTTIASGGMTSIASGSLSGSALNLTSIAGTYKNLQLVLRDYNSSSNANLTFTANGGGFYTYTSNATATSTGTTQLVNSNVNVTGVDTNYSTFSSGDEDNVCLVNIFDYTSTAGLKLFNTMNRYLTSGSIRQFSGTSGSINTDSAITQITMTLSAGTFSGGTYILYGVS